MSTPFFFRKKFLIYYGLFVLLLLLIGIGWTTVKYFEAKVEGRVRWEYITVPLALPIIGLTGYLLILPFWVLHKAKEFRNRAIARIPDMFSAPAATFGEGETPLCEPDSTGYTAPGGRPVLGELNITNQRMLFTRSVDVRRVGVMYGMKEPDLTTSIPLQTIRQCGFGLDEKHPKYFIAIEITGNVHAFGPVAMRNIEGAMQLLGWKETRAGALLYWIR